MPFRDDDPEITKLLAFWFSHAPVDLFNPPPGFDDECRKRYTSLVARARSGSLDEVWTRSARGTLALVLLLDQLPRNIFRGSGEAFASDARALELSLDAIARGLDRQVSHFQSLFFVVPIVHGEYLLAQIAGIAVSAELWNRVRADRDAELAVAAANNRHGWQIWPGLFGRRRKEVLPLPGPKQPLYEKVVLVRPGSPTQISKASNAVLPKLVGIVAKSLGMSGKDVPLENGGGGIDSGAAFADEETILTFLSYSEAAAQMHLDILMKFGRFPGRNAALGRVSTKEEEEFLRQYPTGLMPFK